MALFEWWYEMPWWVRYGLALALILLSTFILLAGRLWIWGWVVGFIMLALAGRSQGEKKGYRRS
ncbi:MAG: hypothetical protein MUE97_02515 [Phycisphaerales bacterium]|jgi:hypothetical protein|nr:hypothetical protein [Phycisphaerales bacterium]